MNAQDIISAADLESEKGIYDALNKSADNDSLLFEVIRQLKAKVGPLQHVLEDALSSVCYFYETSPDKRMARLAKRHIRKIEGAAFKQNLLMRYAGNLAGVELSNESGTQFAVFLPDASEPGRYRYSCFDKCGFFSHATFDTYAEALDSAWLVGFRVQVDNRLQSLCVTEEWSAGSRKTAAIQAVNLGKLTYEAFLQELAA